MDKESHNRTSKRRNPILRFLLTYVFARDHKIIALQFLFSTLIWFFIGGGLALAIRWQLAWPWSDMPIFGPWLFAAEGGQITPEFYNVLFTMHATIMIFFVIIPILNGAFGNYLIPLMIGADDMAFPTLNMFSYWFMWPAFGCIILSFFAPGYGAGAGWTAYPPLSVIVEAAPGAGDAQTLWTMGLLFAGIASLMGSINYLTTIIQMRAPGMTMFRLPMTVWGMFVTAILQAFALPVLTAALLMQLSDRLLGTGFYLAEALSANNSELTSGGGQALLWQHLFWFYSHPAVYIMILPAMGMVSDVLSCFSRKPLFGYRPMIYSITGIAGLGFVVWGHHMFISGMHPMLGMSFMISTMLIALPSGVKVFNWLATLWGGRIQFTTPMLFAISFVSMFIIGGLSGILMAATPVDIVIHDTYYIVAHFHYVLFAGSVMGVFAAIYFWFPKMFGRQMSERVGKLHFFLTFVFLNGTFFPMHFLGARGMPRRYADPYHIEAFKDLESLNIFISYCAFAMGAAQILFVINFLGSMFFGKRVGRNPWNANTLEWTAPSPPPHGNFDFQPIVERGPYEYSHPDMESDYLPQCNSPETTVS
ncbi:cbb3-type cytochrome c oxidase subunit I [Vicingaceae bacterium]|nr:cbb3-type cytochrome c oxidase subunit I [Vicingaceae bacterium]